jgi:putative spermidine/putrescine transport system substrate-binding protein
LVTGLNGYDRFDKIFFWKTPELKCTTQKACAPYKNWDHDYVALKNSTPK